MTRIGEYGLGGTKRPDANYKKQLCLKMTGLGRVGQNKGIWPWRHQGHPDANYKKQLCLKMNRFGNGDQNTGIWPWRHQGHPDANYKKHLRLKMTGLGKVARM